MKPVLWIYPGPISCDVRRMFGRVELPVWVLILVLLFAAVTALDRVLAPSVRWFFRRRMERVVTRLNKRLERPIQPFKLARRHDMIQRLIYDPKVIEAVAERAQLRGIPENVAFQEATGYAREIVPRFSATAYFGFAIRLARLISRSLYKIRTHPKGDAVLKGIDPDATVIFVMNHRSNMDYILVTYLAAKQSALSYAVGEWARVWPLTGLIRAMGAYFIRRRNSNPLYSAVLERYVQLATRAGVAQAVFPEGGLSVTGKIREPKLGILNFIISDFDQRNGRDVVFVPVALNYDRVLEDRILVEASGKGSRRFRFGLFSAIGFVLRQIRFMLTGRYHRFGMAAVSFGTPLSLKGFTNTGDDNMAKSLGEELMARVSAAVPVLPVPLVASVLLEAPRPLSRAQVIQAVQVLVETRLSPDVAVHFPDDNLEKAVDVGLKILTLRRFLLKNGDSYESNPAEKVITQFYATSIAHLLDVPTTFSGGARNDVKFTET